MNTTNVSLQRGGVYMDFKMKYDIETKYLTPKQAGDKKYRRPKVLVPKVMFMVAHDTGNPGSTAYDNIAFYERTHNQDFASAHTFIDDKHIVECIPLTTGTPEKAYHVIYNVTKDNELYGDDANDAAGGVELCYGGHISNIEAYKRYVWYLAYTMYKFGLDPHKHITGHFILDPLRRSDPENALRHIGKTFRDLIEDVAKEYKECVTHSVSEEENKLILKEQWQWDLLANTLKSLYDTKVLNSLEWYEKAVAKNLSVSELAWLNTIIMGRMAGEVRK